MGATRNICFAVVIIWTLMMSRLCYNIGDIDYLQTAGGYEWCYFVFFNILAWHMLEIYTILGVSDVVPLWKNLEDQFVRLTAASGTNGHMHQPYNAMNLSTEEWNTYSYSFDASRDVSLPYVEIAAADMSAVLPMSVSQLYNMSHGFSKVVVFRSLIPVEQEPQHAQNASLLYLLNRYGKQAVPVWVDPAATSTSTEHSRSMRHHARHDVEQYVEMADVVMDDAFSGGSTYDQLKFWNICDKQNNTGLWDYFHLRDSLRIPDGYIGAAALFGTNLPPKKRIDDETDEWYLTTALHCDSGPTLFSMLRGRKLWRLFDAKYSHLLRQDWFATYARSFAHRLPHFNSIPRYELILNEGDVLFFPAWTWHEVYVDHNIGLDLGVSIKMTREVTLWAHLQQSAVYTLNLIGGIVSQQLFYNGEAARSIDACL